MAQNVNEDPIIDLSLGNVDEKRQRLRDIYNQLDVDGDGRVDIKDLAAALHKMTGVESRNSSDFAKLIMAEADLTKDEHIDFKEFAEYVAKKNEKLTIVFKDIDRNADGSIDVNEIKNYLAELDLKLSNEDAEKITKKMRLDGNPTIDLESFQKRHMFLPFNDPLEFRKLILHHYSFDIGEDGTVPDDFTEAEIQSGSWWRHLVSGGVAGAISRTCTAPLDRLKVFLQVHASRQNGLRFATGLKFLLKEGGLKSLWRGNGINVIKIAPESALKFMFYEHIKKKIKRSSQQELSIGERFIAGSMAGAISQTCIYPMEVLKTRLALRKTGELNKGILNAALLIWKHDGLSAFFRGYVPNLIGIIPYAGIDLAVYETLKKFYISRSGDKEPNVVALLMCGTTSSVCGQLASYPLALIRTRLQAHAFSSPASSQNPDTMVGQFQYIVKNEGFTGLYRGLTPNFMKVIPAVGISYVVYETVRKQLGAKMS